MNKLVIIVGLCGLAIGGVGGYLTCHFIDKKNVDAEISKGIQSALNAILLTKETCELLAKG